MLHACSFDRRREAERQERLARAAAYEEAAWVRGEAGSGSEEEEEEVRGRLLVVSSLLGSKFV